MKKSTSKPARNLFHILSQHALKIALLVGILYTLVQKDLSFHVNMKSNMEKLQSVETKYHMEKVMLGLFAYSMTTNLWQCVQYFSTTAPPVQHQNIFSEKKEKESIDLNLANTYSNMGFLDKEVKQTSYRTKKKKQVDYVERFAKLAQSEMRKYRIPASIILAQGLIETNAGESRLSTQNNNHFGMKCFSKSCKKGHCSNFTDDSHKDFFRIYKNAWESYRSHSLMLQGKRYRHLTKLATDDYKNWAKGLKKAGYATDPKYADKLILLIERLKLYEYDQ